MIFIVLREGEPTTFARHHRERPPREPANLGLTWVYVEAETKAQAVDLARLYFAHKPRKLDFRPDHDRWVVEVLTAPESAKPEGLTVVTWVGHTAADLVWTAWPPASA